MSSENDKQNNGRGNFASRLLSKAMSERKAAPAALSASQAEQYANQGSMNMTPEQAKVSEPANK